MHCVKSDATWQMEKKHHGATLRGEEDGVGQFG